MSVSVGEISGSGGNVIVDVNNVDDGESKDGDKEDGGGDGGNGGVGVSVTHKNDQRKERGFGCMPRHLAKVKKAFGSSSNKRSSRRRRRRNDKGCVFCFSRPKTPESPAESHLSDPNDPAFTHEMLRELLEKNDFYCRECNPHLYVHFASCEHR